MKTLYSLIALTILMIASCTTTQLNTALKTATDVLDDRSELTTSEVAKGLKEALIKGAEYSTDIASKTDGYFKNPAIKIPFPPEIQKIETKLRQIGLNKLVDDFILSMNRGAEKAAAEATPIFVNAITNMTIEDAWAILKGDDDAATKYLQKTTGGQLKTKFKPIIRQSLESVNATKYYADITNTYNKIPLVTPLETDLSEYVNNLAIDGLFSLVAKEELAIRKNPIARTSELLKKVFGYEK
jgi:uncharacterized protein DUF4197